MGVFYEFTFALILIDNPFLVNTFFKNYHKKEKGPARMPTILQTTKANR